MRRPGSISFLFKKDMQTSMSDQQQQFISPLKNTVVR